MEKEEPGMPGSWGLWGGWDSSLEYEYESRVRGGWVCYNSSSHRLLRQSRFISAMVEILISLGQAASHS